jgi:hypothetical protein
LRLPLTTSRDGHASGQVPELGYITTAVEGD